MSAPSRPFRDRRPSSPPSPPRPGIYAGPWQSVMRFLPSPSGSSDSGREAVPRPSLLEPPADAGKKPDFAAAGREAVRLLRERGWFVLRLHRLGGVDVAVARDGVTLPPATAAKYPVFTLSDLEAVLSAPDPFAAVREMLTRKKEGELKWREQTI